jgi:hypothetical protein
MEEHLRLITQAVNMSSANIRTVVVCSDTSVRDVMFGSRHTMGYPISVEALTEEKVCGRLVGARNQAERT